MKWCRFSLFAAFGVLVLSTLAGCDLVKKKKDSADTEAKDHKAKEDGEKKSAEVSAEGSSVDIAFLLSMSYTEAKLLSANFLEVPPFYKIAADEIEITKKNEDGTPRRVRAKGRVFVEMSYNDPAKALCQELLLSTDEVILRGKPVLQRGGTTVEGVDDFTIFYMFGSRLRVIGPHRLTNPMQLASNTDALGLPTLGAWTDAPNPLLPPLTESAVPENIRLQAQRATEAELLHQKTRAEFGPAMVEPLKVPETAKTSPPEPKTDTKDENAKKGPEKPGSTSEPKKPAKPKKPSKTNAEGTKAAA